MGLVKNSPNSVHASFLIQTGNKDGKFKKGSLLEGREQASTFPLCWEQLYPRTSTHIYIDFYPCKLLQQSKLYNKYFCSKYLDIGIMTLFGNEEMLLPNYLNLWKALRSLDWPWKAIKGIVGVIHSHYFILVVRSRPRRNCLVLEMRKDSIKQSKLALSCESG